MSSHSLPIFLPGDPFSVGQWATHPDKKLIVFVHGFGGDAIATWNDMQEMLPAIPEVSGCDLAYFSYESLRRRARPSALTLIGFIDGIIKERGEYDRIVIAGHSLGGLIARLAMVQAVASAKDWADSVRLVLFAPADCGASIQELVAGALGTSFLPFLYHAAQLAIPSLQDLKPGSRILNELKATYAAQDPLVTPLRARVIHGDTDSVVDPGPLDIRDDHLIPSCPGRGHFSVCKPKTAFLLPIEEVVRAL